MILAVNDLVTIVAGKISKTADNLSISGVSTDSRNLQRGNLFVPLTGEHFDGHSFIEAAEKNGAAASLWNEAISIPKNVNIPLILVDDTLMALQSLAKEYRQRSKAIIVGVTGSNGKTTTKDLISAILSSKYQVHKTQGNLNNHIGVPLTLLSMPEDTEVAVIEMGMSNLGEIDSLSKIAKPDIAIITNIGESHLEFLKTRENIAIAKLEIINGLKEQGIIILPGDEPLIRTAINQMNILIRKIWIGEKADCNNIFPENIRVQNNQETVFEDGQGVSYTVPLLGFHNVLNSLMAIQVGKLLHLSNEQIQAGLENLKLTGMRLEKHTAKNGSLILNDTYNASPTSMKASLKLLAELAQFKVRVAVLGDMLELGENAVGYHKNIGKFCHNLRIDFLIATGELGKWIATGAKEEGMLDNKLLITDDCQEIISYLNKHFYEDTVILIKGSRGARLERIITGLLP